MSVKIWKRISTLGGSRSSSPKETWQYTEGNELIASFEVDVTIGKPLNVLGLKGHSLQSVMDYSAFLQSIARELYVPGRAGRVVRECPCCNEDSENAAMECAVFGIPYYRCMSCGHIFVRFQPLQEDLDRVFAESEEHSSTYTDLASLEIRLEQVIKPKIKWIRDVYLRHCRRKPNIVMDVGAGGGHFLEGLRRDGIGGEGYELSRSSRRFAKEVFGIDLRSTDFLLDPRTQDEFDVVTFWGLLEYTPEPRKFLERAHRMLHPQNGMLIVEVPRFNCLGSSIQKECTDTIARHLDPTSHVNCFTDSSLATVMYQTGFKPVAVWYFGMDAYELMVQIALKLQYSEIPDDLVRLIPPLQACMDYGRLCDDLIVAALPLS